MRDVYRIAKLISNKRNGNTFTQPAVDQQGNIITSTEQQLNAWADFLENKFKARANEPEVDLHQDTGPDDPGPDISLQGVKAWGSKLKSNKATGQDMIPAEQFKASEPAVTELHQVLQTIWREEDIPQDFVLADMMLLYKKKCRNNRANYRCLGLLNHSYKIFAMVLLMRIMPFITPKLSDTQAGFRKGRGCRDNVFILVTTIQHLQSAETEAQSRGIITYIDFTAAFDSILHSYLFNALKQYGVPPKYCRLVQCVYKSAKAIVRLQDPGGNRSHSRSI